MSFLRRHLDELGGQWIIHLCEISDFDELVLEYSSDLGISLLFLRTQRSWIEVGLQDSTWDLNHFESC